MRATCWNCLCIQCPPAHGTCDCKSDHAVHCTPSHARRCVPRHLPGCCVPCLDCKLARCLREAIQQWCRIHCYHVCEVRPPRACPGEEILIVGCGFGDRPGASSSAARADASTSLSVAPKSWCDDRITVVVPQGAGCGLWLELPPKTIAVCGRFLELRPIGCIDKGFEGTSAEILRFDIKGHTAGECPLQPGEPLRIRWNTCAADRVRVELIDLVEQQRHRRAGSGRRRAAAGTSPRRNFTRTVRDAGAHHRQRHAASRRRFRARSTWCSRSARTCRCRVSRSPSRSSTTAPTSI